MGHQVLPVGGHPHRPGGATIVHLQGALLLVWITALATAILPGKEGFYVDAYVV